MALYELKICMVRAVAVTFIAMATEQSHISIQLLFTEAGAAQPRACESLAFGSLALGSLALESLALGSLALRCGACLFAQLWLGDVQIEAFEEVLSLEISKRTTELLAVNSQLLLRHVVHCHHTWSS